MKFRFLEDDNTILRVKMDIFDLNILKSAISVLRDYYGWFFRTIRRD